MSKLERLLDELINQGSYIREKLDKRGFDGNLDGSDLVTDWDSNKHRVKTEVILPMKRFIELFESLK